MRCGGNRVSIRFSSRIRANGIEVLSYQGILKNFIAPSAAWVTKTQWASLFLTRWSDGTRNHWTFIDNFLGKLIFQNGGISDPLVARTWMALLGFWLWGTLKRWVYSTAICDLRYFEQRLCEEIDAHSCNQWMPPNAVRNYTSRHFSTFIFLPTWIHHILVNIYVLISFL